MSDSIPKQKIMVVDDKAQNIHILMQTLKENYHMTAAINGKKALELAIINKPDLILLDIMMPEMDGYEVCEKLKADDETKNIPVIFITAKSEATDETKGFKLGAVDYITKPFSPLVVRARVKMHMELKLHRDRLEDLVASRTSELSLLNKQITNLLDATKELLQAENAVSACSISIDHLASLQETGSFNHASLFLPEKNGESFNEYILWNENGLIENPSPKDIESDRASGLKQIKSITNTDDTLLIPIKSGERLLGILDIERSMGLSKANDQFVEGIIRSLALTLENIEAEENRKMAGIGAMAATIVHDLKNPIGTILGYAEMGADEDFEHEERVEFMDIITEEANRLADMAHEVLEFSRGELTLSVDEVEAVQYVDDLAKTLMPLFKEHGIEFKHKSEYEGILKLDADRLRRVILNLATNAADAMAGAITQNACFTLSLFENNGKLFEPFVTHGKSHGTGLGMAIVKKIIKAHNGDISFETEVGKGTKFILQIPK